MVASGGSAMAARLITGAEIKDGSVRARDARNGSLGGRDFRRGSIGGKAFKRSSLTGRVVRLGSIEPKDLAGAGRALATAAGATIAPGKTMKGVWGGRFTTPYNSSNREEADRNSHVLFVSFPAPVPEPLAADEVNFKSAGAKTADPDAGCNGTLSAPSAPPGKVCVYLNTSRDENLFSVEGKHISDPTLFADLLGPGGVPNSLGFTVAIRVIQDPCLLCPPPQNVQAQGTWAYTAPSA
jgi:hypothetical protein